MNIKFRYMELEEVASVLAWSAFMRDGVLPLSEGTFKLYPEVKKLINARIITKNMEYKDRIGVISKNIEENYQKSLAEFQEYRILEHYQSIWNKYNDEYFKVLSNYFKVSIDNDVDAAIGLIPVCPRYIKNLSFYANGMNDEKLIETCMHECCHFYFFELCKKIFEKWEYTDFDSPSLLWYLSEISIDAILNRDLFQKVFRYYFRAYNNFYDVFINNECIVDTIRNIFDTNDVEDAIKISLQYLEDNKDEFIRKCNGGKEL